ncbi:hypothetical protein H9L10_03455 [Phycicoccus endophyticus]|uniref:Uncharacterized protein n=1 Tax=Phycicoccus endophyticus TaxID=1690220 RepID=A0A7G9R3F1_9MICO|nr:hypothetical protein [Phycicoccus endophyticus]QNN50126.1 hypothetical protein H9L10_03455 [Phycicoccus endophyticus]GGL27798.1 hypothetical protein GCM10012283_07530 [Phycicoccus endophyticus]
MTTEAWEYRLHDFDPARDGDEEEWAQARAAEGWQMWASPGAWVSIEGRRLRRWSLRRPADEGRSAS